MITRDQYVAVIDELSKSLDAYEDELDDRGMPFMVGWNRVGDAFEATERLMGEMMHELKGIYALLKNNIDLDEKHGWSPEKAQAQHKKVMRLACDKLKVLFDCKLSPRPLMKA